MTTIQPYGRPWAKCARPTCGNLFRKQSPNHRYCSSLCRAIDTIGPRTCRNGHHSWQPMDADKAKNPYCSRECYLAACGKPNEQFITDTDVAEVHRAQTA